MDLFSLALVFDKKWMVVASSNEKTVKADFDKVISFLLNAGLPSIVYTVANEETDHDIFTPFCFTEDHRFPGGSMNSPFQVVIDTGKDGEPNIIRLVSVINKSLAEQFRIQLITLGFNDVVYGHSTETRNKLMSRDF